MATKKLERTFSSFDELTKEYLPSEFEAQIEAEMDSTALGHALAAESLTVMQRALSANRSRRGGADD